MTHRRILYIAGAPHCGSTLLDIMLGHAPGACSTGEIDNLYKGDLCACGKSLEQCPLWSRVLAAPNLPDGNLLKRMAALNQKERGYLAVLASKALCRRYASVQDRVFRAIFQASGANVLIDSSKYVTRALALARASEYSILIIHLIRDPRGYINSLNKRHRREGENQEYASAMLKWLLKNGAASLTLKPFFRESYLRLSYEELLLHPKDTLKRIGEFSGIDVSDIISRIQNQEPFQGKHLAHGNGIALKEQIQFDASHVQSNRLRGMKNSTFWQTIGWLSAFWGYTRSPSYLRPHTP